MEVKLTRIYSGKKFPKEKKFIYDKTSKKRPAWILIKNLQKNIMFLNTKINGKIEHYRAYLSPDIPLFLPTNYTREEMRKYYDKFSEIYDDEIKSKNEEATIFLFGKIKLNKNIEILDLGAGSGISAVPLVKKGYKNITLVDFSKKMLEKAKKKKELKGCKFLQKDITKLNLNKKYDLILSIFSFASKSYFNEEEMQKLWRRIYSHLKPQGILMIMGNDFEPPSVLIRKIKSGKYEIVPKYKSQWYIGIRK